METTEDADAKGECAGRQPVLRRRALDLFEVILGYALILAVIWTPRPLQRWLYCLALGWFVVSIAISFPGWRAFGCRIDGFRRSSWIIGLAVGIATTAISIAGILHTLHHPDRPVQWLLAFGGYTVWSLVQQLLLQGYFLTRFLRLLPSATWAAISAALIFALAHLPNPILTAATLLWGLVACLVFLKWRNIWPLAMAHAILGISVATTIPGPVIRNMRVGLGYLRYQPPAHPLHLSQSDHTVSTTVWVTAEAPTRR